MITVWATYKNQDMTEGRGPMIRDKVFLNERDAHDYINQQEGIFGRKAPEAGWQNSRLGDWEVKPISVLEHLDDTEEHARAEAIRRAYAKLTSEEKAAVEFHVRNALI